MHWRKAGTSIKVVKETHSESKILNLSFSSIFLLPPSFLGLNTKVCFHDVTLFVQSERRVINDFSYVGFADLQGREGDL